MELRGQKLEVQIINIAGKEVWIPLSRLKNWLMTVSVLVNNLTNKMILKWQESISFNYPKNKKKDGCSSIKNLFIFFWKKKLRWINLHKKYFLYFLFFDGSTRQPAQKARRVGIFNPYYYGGLTRPTLLKALPTAGWGEMGRVDPFAISTNKYNPIEKKLIDFLTL